MIDTKRKILSVFIILSMVMTCFNFTITPTFAASKKAPSKPTLSSASITSQNNPTATVTIKWKKAKNAKTYAVYYKKGSGSYKLLKTTTALSVTHKINKTTSKIKYTYKVRCKGTGKYTKWSGYSKTKAVTIPIVKYTVTFKDKVDNKILSTQSISPKGLVKIPANPSHKGYSFTKWTNDAGTTLNLKTYKITKNQNIWANFSYNTYTVRYLDGVTNSVISTQKVNCNTKLTYPTPPTHDGYAFTGWSSTPSNVYQNTDITAKYKQVTIPVTPTKYNVKFIDGIDGSTLLNKDVEKGSSVTPPTPKTHEGYTFAGWSNNSYNNVQSNLIITANYTEDEIVTNTYTITFHDTISNTDIQTFTVNEGDSVTPPNPTNHDGYEFKNWDSEEYKNVTKDAIINTVYDELTYTVKFIDSVNNNILLEKTVKYGESVNPPTVPSHDGYTFSCWSSDDYAYVTSNLTITTVYNTEVHTVTFINGVTNETIISKTVEHGKTVSFPNVPAVNGYTFIGWSEPKSKVITEDITIIANYEQKVSSVITVYYKLGLNGSAQQHTQLNSYVGDIYTLPKIDKTITQNGKTYEFSEWYASNGCTLNNPASEYDNSLTITEPVATLLALYTEKETETFTVTFYDTITSTEIYSQSVAIGQSVTPPQAPAHDGYEFSGWNSEDYKHVTKNCIISTVYTPVQKFTIEFIDGVNNNKISSQEVLKGQTATPPTPPTHSGYTFKYWNSTDYQNVQKNATITAIYQKNNVPMHSYYFYDGITFDTLLEGEAEEGSSIEPPTPPEHDGYTFKGWSNNDYENLTDDIIVEAQYTKNTGGGGTTPKTYSVKFYDKDGNVIKSATVEAGSSVEPPSIDQEYMAAPDDPYYYNFTGWSTNAYTNVQSTLQIYPQYEKINMVRIEFWDENQPTPIQTTAYVKKGTNTSTMDITYPEPEQYNKKVFAYWDGEVPETLNETISIVARYRNVYTVTFKDRLVTGNNGKIDEQTIVENASAIEPVPPTHDKYIFTGWSTNEWKNVTKDLTVYAEYTRIYDTSDYEIADSLNGQTFTIYALNTNYTNNIEIPEGLPTSLNIGLDEDWEYTIDGVKFDLNKWKESCIYESMMPINTIIENGVLTPRFDIMQCNPTGSVMYTIDYNNNLGDSTYRYLFYRYGTSHIKAIKGNNQKTIEFDVIIKDYADIWANTETQKIINEAITNPNLNDYGKMKAIMSYLGQNFGYDGRYYTDVWTLINKTGDCWGLNSILIRAAHLLGLQSHIHFENGTPTNQITTKGHQTCAVKLNAQGDVGIFDAGTTGANADMINEYGWGPGRKTSAEYWPYGFKDVTYGSTNSDPAQLYQIENLESADESYLIPLKRQGFGARSIQNIEIFDNTDNLILPSDYICDYNNNTYNKKFYSLSKTKDWDKSALFSIWCNGITVGKITVPNTITIEENAIPENYGFNIETTSEPTWTLDYTKINTSSYSTDD